MAAARTTWRRVARRLVVAIALGLAAPLSWAPLTLGEHLRAAWVVASIALVALLVVRRIPTAQDRYAAALVDAVALRVRLGHVRVAAAHESDGRPTAVVTWREAQTDLLDREGHVLAGIGRNALATGWTMSVRLDEADIAWLLSPDGGRLELLAGVDIDHDPWARIGNSPLLVRRCEVALSA